MQEYLTYAPIVVFLVWVYIFIQSFKGFNNFKKVTGKTYKELLNPFLNYKIEEDIKGKSEVEEAYIEYKRRTKRFFYIWLLTILMFMIISVIVGILTANKAQ